jgi:biopolymer transport protein ExbD
MPKIKLPTKSPHIDMTPMVDTFCVVLTFLMLTATMRQPEPAAVDTPYSISEKPTPDFNTMTFLLSTDDKVFMNFDNGGMVSNSHPKNSGSLKNILPRLVCRF